MGGAQRVRFETHRPSKGGTNCEKYELCHLRICRSDRDRTGLKDQKTAEGLVNGRGIISCRAK